VTPIPLRVRGGGRKKNRKRIRRRTRRMSQR